MTVSKFCMLTVVIVVRSTGRVQELSNAALLDCINHIEVALHNLSDIVSNMRSELERREQNNHQDNVFAALSCTLLLIASLCLTSCVLCDRWRTWV